MNQSSATAASAGRLAGYSFLILFFELALIRYLPGYVRIVGFYANLVLIAAFLGMSVGLLRAAQADKLRWLAVPVFIVLFAVVVLFSNVTVQPPTDPDDVLWTGLGVSPNAPEVGVGPVALLLFGLTVAVFIPLGALLGKEFAKFKPLHAYSIDIAGSLLGILTFALFSWLRTPPPLWFAFGFLVWLLLSLDARRFAAALGLTAAAVVSATLVTAGPQPEYWSPYYRINVLRAFDRYVLFVNGTFHQHVIDMEAADDSPEGLTGRMRDDYLRPFALVGPPDTVLIVGAGTGNDVANLLLAGAKHIDAVEIDPVILDVGRALHFQEPYADPRVRAHVNDARAYLRNTTQQYDAIVFGTLDSHAQLAGMGSLRLDNYVYTRQAFEAARDRLKPDGVLIAYHMSLRPYIAAKLNQLITEAFDESPLVLHTPGARFFNYTFVAGPVRDTVVPTEQPPADFYAQTETPVDDWPYLYLRQRTVPGHYLTVLFGMLLIGALYVGVGAGRGMLQGGLDGVMFFMGVGFLLVETKSVTEMALLFGSTWVVNLLVFSSILVVILLANAVVIRWPPGKLHPLFMALVISLALAYAVPIRSLLWLGPVGKWIVGGTIVALPVFFAAIIFATIFATRADATRALAFNVMGAVIGGLMEYSSMVTGIKALYLIAMVAYVGAWVAVRGRVVQRVGG